MQSECNYYFVCYANAQVLYLIMCTDYIEPTLYVYAHAHHCLGIYCYTSTRAHYCVILLYNPLSENISSVSMYALSGSKATPFNSV